MEVGKTGVEVREEDVGDIVDEFETELVESMLLYFTMRNQRGSSRPENKAHPTGETEDPAEIAWNELLVPSIELSLREVSVPTGAPVNTYICVSASYTST